MHLYRYKALNEVAKTIRGQLKAVNEADLEARLKEAGLDLVECSKVNQATNFFTAKNIKSQELIIFCVQLEQLERAGVTILEALSDIRDTSENVTVKTIVSEIFENVRNGNMLSEALAKHPGTFDEVFIGLIKAGEVTGNLSDILANLASHLKWVDEIKQKVKKASYYPIFMLLLMGCVISVMMIFVIPKLITFLEAQRIELPIYTKALIATSNMFINHGLIIFVFIAVLIFTFKILNRTNENFMRLWDSIKLRLPIVGQIIRKSEMARFCRFFAINYSSGIGILECLDVASGVISNKVIKESVADARKKVAEGESVTKALDATGQFPSLVVRMIRIGEESGKLETSLANVNYFYDKEVNEGINNMIAVIQPTLTLVMGAIMMWISMSVFGPLYGSFKNINF